MARHLCPRESSVLLLGGICWGCVASFHGPWQGLLAIVVATPPNV